MIENILFPVDFSPPCAAIAAYVKRAALICGARVTLNSRIRSHRSQRFELYVRPLPEIADEHRELPFVVYACLPMQGGKYFALRLFSDSPHLLVIQPWCSRRYRSGYREPC
jgi:hypothetical protein